MPQKGDSLRNMSPNRKTKNLRRKTKMSNNKSEAKQEDLPQKGDSLRKMSPNRKTQTQKGNQTSSRNTCP